MRGETTRHERIEDITMRCVDFLYAQSIVLGASLPNPPKSYMGGCQRPGKRTLTMLDPKKVYDFSGFDGNFYAYWYR